MPDHNIFTIVAGWPIEQVRSEFASLIRHTDEDALDRGELLLLAACSWWLANGH